MYVFLLFLAEYIIDHLMFSTFYIYPFLGYDIKSKLPFKLLTFIIPFSDE